MFQDALSHISYLGIILFLIGTGVGLPIPEEVPIIAAGVAASVGTLNPWLAYGACLIGALVGDCALYGIGYHFGHNLAKLHPRLAQLLHAEHEQKIEQMLRRHGLKVLFFARFLVGIRGPIYLTVGVLRMRFRQFLLVDAVCATVVVSAFYGLSYLFGNVIAEWIHHTEVWLTILVLVGLAIAGVVWLKRRWMAKLEAGNGQPAE
jgi:membrane protein DedA with SNARE-associated domain